MTQQEAGPSADNSNDATGCADELFGPGKIPGTQKQNAGARAKAGEQIKKRELDRADDPFQAGSDDEERVEIEDEVEQPVMEKERGKHSPVFATVANRPWFEGAEPVQSERARRAAQFHFGDKHREVQHDEGDDRGRWAPRIRTKRAGDRPIRLLDPMEQCKAGRRKGRARDQIGSGEAMRDFG